LRFHSRRKPLPEGHLIAGFVVLALIFRITGLASASGDGGAFAASGTQLRFFHSI
jgi:hypothetical protein